MARVAANTTTKEFSPQVEVYGKARQESFQKRVIQGRLNCLVAEADALLGDLALLNQLCLLECASKVEARLTEVTREALRYRAALEGRGGFLEAVAPRLAEMAWA